MEEGFEQNKGRKKEKGNRPGQIGKRRGEREKKISTISHRKKNYI